MKRFRKGLIARALSWVLTVAMVMPGLVSVTTLPAVAQQPARGTVAVVDFLVRPGLQQALLSRAATDAVALEMSRAGFNVIARSQVQDALQELSLDPILDRLGIIKLGTTLAVDSIVSGEVVAVSVDGSPRTARVTILVRVTDVASGEDVNGAAVTGRSNPRIGFVADDDQLIREAISNAALEAVKTIAAYTIPEATVLNTLGEDEVVLNRGTRHGLKAGMEMIVLRGKEVVGRIRVTRPSASESTAKILSSTLGIQPEDRARAVFKLPVVQVVGGKVKMAEPRAKPKSAGLSNLGKLLVVAGLIFGALQVGKGGNPGVHVGEGTPKAEACIYQGVPAVKISWRHSVFAQSNNDRVLYQIYRDPGDPTRPRVPVLTAERSMTEAYDTNIPRTVNYVQIEPGQEVDSPDLEEEEDVPGITPGQSYRYAITLIYRFVSPFVGQPGGGQPDQQEATYRESDRTFTGQATPLTPPQLLQPANGREDVDLTAVTFEFQAVPGAQAYRVEVSTDPTFRDKSRSFYTDEVSFPAGATVVIRNVNLSGKFRPEQRLYWRAGARNVGDNPGPLPDGAGYRYIWSTEPFSFTAPVTPPPPPGL
ncbi:MAG: hypothetical protein RMM06_00235 [Armatimonadota bacterium]|nr:CsgG/HfaB family protein [bacterium]MDW8289119.1 hypothetical protein [Armatimonadota bacterium]